MRSISSIRLVFGFVTMAMVMLLFLQCFAEADERSNRSRSTSSRSRSSSPSSPRSNNRGRGTGANSRTNQNRWQDQSYPYYQVCPEVYCPEVSPTCQTVEYIVYEDQYEIPGRGLVNIRCQSCSYCLDLPSHFMTSREIRDYGDASGRNNPCAAVQCPAVPDACADVRLTNVFISGQLCGQCQACYDRAIFLASP